MVDEAGAAAIHIPNSAVDVGRPLVPVGGEANIDRIAAFGVALVGGRDIGITLLTVAEAEAAPDEAPPVGDGHVGARALAFRRRPMRRTSS